jgi:hypothetical protein
MLNPRVQMAALGLQGFGTLGVFHRFVKGEIFFYALAEFRRALQNRQVVFFTLRLQPAHGGLRLCHGLHPSSGTRRTSFLPVFKSSTARRA